MINILSVPAIASDTSTLDAALAYAANGWYVLPVRRGTKHPGSVLGNEWQSRSSREPAQLMTWFNGTNSGIALHCGRSGAVVLDVDHPEALPPELAEVVYRPDVPFQSTRSDTPGRGHAIFRMPEGRHLGNSNGELGKAWGEVRGHNGVIIVAPSEHEKAAEGGCYVWARRGPSPVLPDEIAERVPERGTKVSSSPFGGDEAGAATDGEVAAFIAENAEASKPSLLIPVQQHFNRRYHLGESRHDAARDATCWATREALAGAYPAAEAFDHLRAAFVAAMATPLDSTGRVLDVYAAQAEFDGIVAWAIGQANAEGREACIDRLLAHGSDDQRDSSLLPNLPAEFWKNRPSLEHIRDAAHARMCSADLVLHAVLARLASLQHYTTRVDTGILNPAPVNFFTAAVGLSGAGKSTSQRIARDLIPTPTALVVEDLYREDAPLGSGEGLAELFMGMVDEPTGEEYKSGTRKGEQRLTSVRRQVRHNVSIYCDEGEALVKLLERSGATIGPALRSAWCSEDIGQSNASTETTRVVARDTYSLGLVIGFQPETITPLFADAAGGTPQRFLFCSATDPSIPEDPVAFPGPLPPLNPVMPVTEGCDRIIPVADEGIRASLRAKHLHRHQGRSSDENPLDAHKPLHLAKTAALLALLDGRHQIDSFDWNLAEIIVRTSSRVRDALVERRRKKVSRQMEEKSNQYVAREERVEAARSQVLDKVDRIARNIAKKVREGGATSRSQLNKSLASRDRDLFANGLEHAIAQGWITVTGQKVEATTARLN